MRVVRGFARFWYDFIVGDDWKIAVAVVAAVALTVGLLELDVVGDAGVCVIGAILVAAGFATSLAIDVRAKR